MAFETNDPVTELRAKAKEMFPWDEKLAKATYHWHAADKIAELQRALTCARQQLVLLGGDAKIASDDDQIQAQVLYVIDFALGK